MPIRMVCVKRFDRGEPDVHCPMVFCDQCGERIEDAARGGYYWNHPLPAENVGDAYYEPQNEIWFLHSGECHRHWAARHGEPDMWMPLSAFPVFLARNLKVKVSVPKGTEEVLAIFSGAR